MSKRSSSSTQYKNNKITSPSTYTNNLVRPIEDDEETKSNDSNNILMSTDSFRSDEPRLSSPIPKPIPQSPSQQQHPNRPPSTGSPAQYSRPSLPAIWQQQLQEGAGDTPNIRDSQNNNDLPHAVSSTTLPQPNYPRGLSSIEIQGLPSPPVMVDLNDDVETGLNEGGTHHHHRQHHPDTDEEEDDDRASYAYSYDQTFEPQYQGTYFDDDQYTYRDDGGGHPSSDDHDSPFLKWFSLWAGAQDQENFVEKAREEIDKELLEESVVRQKKMFLVALVQAFSEYGGSTHRIEFIVGKTAAALNIRCQCMILPNMFLLTFTDRGKFIDPTSSTTIAGRLSRGLDLYKCELIENFCACIYRLSKRLRRERAQRRKLEEQARARDAVVDRLLDVLPPEYIYGHNQDDNNNNDDHDNEAKNGNAAEDQQNNSWFGGFLKSIAGVKSTWEAARAEADDNRFGHGFNNNSNNNVVVEDDYAIDQDYGADVNARKRLDRIHENQVTVYSPRDDKSPYKSNFKDAQTIGAFSRQQNNRNPVSLTNLFDGTTDNPSLNHPSERRTSLLADPPLHQIKSPNPDDDFVMVDFTSLEQQQQQQQNQNQTYLNNSNVRSLTPGPSPHPFAQHPDHQNSLPYNNQNTISLPYNNQNTIISRGQPSFKGYVGPRQQKQQLKQQQQQQQQQQQKQQHAMQPPLTQPSSHRYQSPLSSLPSPQVPQHHNHQMAGGFDDDAGYQAWLQQTNEDYYDDPNEDPVSRFTNPNPPQQPFYNLTNQQQQQQQQRPHQRGPLPPPNPPPSFTSPPSPNETNSAATEPSSSSQVNNNNNDNGNPPSSLLPTPSSPLPSSPSQIPSVSPFSPSQEGPTNPSQALTQDQLLAQLNSLTQQVNLTMLLQQHQQHLQNPPTALSALPQPTTTVPISATTATTTMAMPNNTTSDAVRSSSQLQPLTIQPSPDQSTMLPASFMTTQPMMPYFAPVSPTPPIGSAQLTAHTVPPATVPLNHLSFPYPNLHQLASSPPLQPPQQQLHPTATTTSTVSLHSQPAPTSSNLSSHTLSPPFQPMMSSVSIPMMPVGSLSSNFISTQPHESLPHFGLDLYTSHNTSSVLLPIPSVGSPIMSPHNTKPQQPIHDPLLPLPNNILAVFAPSPTQTAARQQVESTNLTQSQSNPELPRVTSLPDGHTTSPLALFAGHPDNAGHLDNQEDDHNPLTNTSNNNNNNNNNNLYPTNDHFNQEDHLDMINNTFNNVYEIHSTYSDSRLGHLPTTQLQQPTGSYHRSHMNQRSIYDDGSIIHPQRSVPNYQHEYNLTIYKRKREKKARQNDLKPFVTKLEKPRTRWESLRQWKAIRFKNLDLDRPRTLIIALQQIIQEETLYPPVFFAVAIAIMGPAAAFGFFEGGKKEVFISLWLSILVAFIDYLAGFYEIIAALQMFATSLIVAFLAATVRVEWYSSLCMYPTMLSALLWLLPGLSITSAVIELSARSMISGTTRFINAIFATLQMGFGMAIGMNLVLWEPLDTTTPCIKDISGWWILLAFPVISVTMNIALRAHPRQWLGMTISSGIALFGSVYLGKVIPAVLSQDLTTIACAFIIGIFSSLWSIFISSEQAIVYILSGIIFLVPGSITVKGMFEMMQSTSTNSTGFFVVMLRVTTSIAVGMFASRFVLPTAQNTRASLLDVVRETFRMTYRKHRTNAKAREQEKLLNHVNRMAEKQQTNDNDDPNNPQAKSTKNVPKSTESQLDLASALRLDDVNMVKDRFDKSVAVDGAPPPTIMLPRGKNKNTQVKRPAPSINRGPPSVHPSTTLNQRQQQQQQQQQQTSAASLQTQQALEQSNQQLQFLLQQLYSNQVQQQYEMQSLKQQVILQQHQASLALVHGQTLNSQLQQHQQQYQQEHQAVGVHFEEEPHHHHQHGHDGDQHENGHGDDDGDSEDNIILSTKNHQDHHHKHQQHRRRPSVHHHHSTHHSRDNSVAPHNNNNNNNNNGNNPQIYSSPHPSAGIHRPTALKSALATTSTPSPAPAPQIIASGQNIQSQKMLNNTFTSRQPQHDNFTRTSSQLSHNSSVGSALPRNHGEYTLPRTQFTIQPPSHQNTFHSNTLHTNNTLHNTFYQHTVIPIVANEDDNEDGDDMGADGNGDDDEVSDDGGKTVAPM